MTIEYIVSYPHWTPSRQWHRAYKKFTDIVKRNHFIRAKNDEFNRAHTPVGNLAYVKTTLLHSDEFEYTDRERHA